MTTITSAQDGYWDDAATWTGGVVPSSSDTAEIAHDVVIRTDVSVGAIKISTGSLKADTTTSGASPLTLTVGHMTMDRILNDYRVVRLDGINLIIGLPSITALGSTTFPNTSTGVMSSEGEVIIDDPGLYGFSSQMQDIKPEGCARAYARKVSNGVRYLNVVVHIRKDKSNIVGQLYRMAENPFQVLATTNSAVIKGFIEAISPMDSVGKEYRSFKVSIAEGL